MSKNLHKAKKNKNDEFYTQLSDIENELQHYSKHFAGKTVYCNCDDARVSNFFYYFAYNFEKLKLKKLITSCYRNQNTDLFSRNESDKPVCLEYTGGKRPDSNEIEIEIKYLNGDGDFRSDESIKLLKSADIVVTNPPFSLFREYVAQLIEYDKKFLIVGNHNATGYKDIFKLIKENKIWLGYGFKKGKGFFIDGGNYENYTTATKKKEGILKVLIPVCWLTNLEIDKRNELGAYKRYSDTEYPKYVNYDAINVDKVKDIPMDYEGVMGVPLTFFQKYNPNQFEIIALGKCGYIEFTNNRKMEVLKNGKPTGSFFKNAKGCLYRKYNPAKDKVPNYKDVENGELYTSIYVRILMRKKTLDKN